jgi:hypothetical protein
MVYLMGPSLDAELDYRRAELMKTGNRVAGLGRRARRVATRAADHTARPTSPAAATTATNVHRRAA